MTVPLILIRGGDEVVSPAAAELAATGWVVREGWRLPDQAWGVTRMVCVGVVRSREDASDAVLAAARGAGLVAGLQAPSEVVEQLYEDLRRLGRVELRDGTPPTGDVGALEPEQRALLQLLGSGMTLDEVAAELNYSRRTVSRRLAAARRALDVRTNAEAISAIVRGDRRENGD